MDKCLKGKKGKEQSNVELSKIFQWCAPRSLWDLLLVEIFVCY